MRNVEVVLQLLVISFLGEFHSTNSQPHHDLPNGSLPNGSLPNGSLANGSHTNGYLSDDNIPVVPVAPPALHFEPRHVHTAYIQTREPTTEYGPLPPDSNALRTNIAIDAGAYREPAAPVKVYALEEEEDAEQREFVNAFLCQADRRFLLQKIDDNNYSKITFQRLLPEGNQ